MWINRISTVLHETERYMQWTSAIPNIKYKFCAIQTKIPKVRLHSIQNMLKFHIIEHDILSRQNIEYYQSQFGRQVLETGGNGWKTLWKLLPEAIYLLEKLWENIYNPQFLLQQDILQISFSSNLFRHDLNLNQEVR